MIAPKDDTYGRITDDGAFRHNGHLKVFNHHVYEYRKGLRHLALQTLPCGHEPWVTARLEKLGIDHVIFPAGTQHINVFLGDSECLEVIRLIGKSDLSRYTPEEDFMLGIMLGYGRRQQCARYLNLIRQVEDGHGTLPDNEESGECFHTPMAIYREDIR